MSIAKRLVAIFLSCIMLFTIVSCSQQYTEESTSTEDVTVVTTTEKTDETKEIVSTIETSDEETEETTEEDVSNEYIYGYDPIVERVGSYILLEYNPMYCSIETDVKKGLGSKETVEMKVTMRDGYIFDGWSSGDYICNKDNLSAISMDRYSIVVSGEKKIYINCSMKVNYDANGGVTKDSKTLLETTYSLSEYKCPSTLPDQGYFTREGYVLSEYNTKPDGSGKSVGLGSKIRSEGSTLTLYCIWLKTDNPADFEYTESDSVSITKYVGESKDVVIPETINGKNVTCISKKAFNESSAETVFLPKTIETVEMGAFYKCSNLREIVFFDNIQNIYDNSVAECPNFRNIRINAVYNLYNVGWITGTYCKVDRIIWAENMKKFIFYGGSGSMYGIRSSLVNDEIGDEYVVINYGANANVSAAFAFEGIMKWLHEGDIMMWHPEASPSPMGDSRMNGSLGRRNFEFYVLSNYDFLKGVDITKYRDFFSTMMIVFGEHESHQTSWDKGSIAYNCYGDAENHVVHEEIENTYHLDIFTSSNDYSRMTWVIDELKKKGVDTWFSYGVMDEEGKGLEKDKAEKYRQDILEHFDVTIISELSNCLVAHKYFADSKWHLTKEGADVRTVKLLRDILKQFEKTKTE